MDTNELISIIKTIKGIKQVKFLDSEQREFLQEIELQEEKDTGVINQGIKEVMQMKIVLIATHDNTFREPHEEIVRGNVVFSTSFPELKQKNIDAIMASPSKESHEYLKAFIKVDGEGTNEDATLLIGV